MKLARRVLICLILALSVSPAFASDHFARVNEVMLSFGGDSTKQFIEIEDTQNEAFSGQGYTLFVYGADGTTQAHSQPLVMEPGTMRITIASSSAFTQFGLSIDQTPPDMTINLAAPLPPAGTACFRKIGVDLHCFSYGAVVAPTQTPANGKVAGPAPMDSMSVQRQPTCAGVGAPTPNAANAQLQCVDPPMGDAGVGGDAGTNPPSDDDGCSVRGDGNWFGLVATVSMIGMTRVVRRNRRRVA
jgi:hypothetical protein